MPIGHALMVLNEKILIEHKLWGAFAIGFIGVICLFIGIYKEKNKSIATLLGLLAGVLIWTGWVEFSFVWIADKLHVSPLIENGEVTTKPEYLVMLSSVGLLISMCTYYLFTNSKCQFFIWFQKIAGIRKQIVLNKPMKKLVSIVTFIETIMILWFFYIVLLLVYDNSIAGDKHPATYFVAFGSLFWSIYLFLNLVRISKFDYAIRYAVPTVIIFWNFIEVIGRWNLLEEIWIAPFEHWLENAIILVLFIGFIVYYVIETKRNKAIV